MFALTFQVIVRLQVYILSVCLATHILLFGFAQANSNSSAKVSQVAEEENVQLDGLPIDSISIENTIGRTRDSFIRGKLSLKEGEPYLLAELEEGLKRLRATRLFRDARAKAFQRIVNNESRVHIEIVLDEKWTTLPDIRFGGGGGTAFFRLGVYDINWMGLGVEGLISYENRNGTNNGDAWFRWPRAFETNNLFGAGIRRSALLLTDYDENRQVRGGELMSKTTLLLDFERPLTDHIIFGYRMEPEWVTFNQFQVAANVVSANREFERPLSQGSRRILHRTQIRLSYLDYAGVLTDGFEFTSEWIPAISGFGSDTDILITRHELKFFKILNWETNLGVKAVIGTSSDSKPENEYRLGGLNEVRGYYDGEFKGRYLMLSNIELRKNLFETWSFVWQPTVFYDIGKVEDTPEGLKEGKVRDAFGIGLRIIPDFVHLAALRLDYAWGVSDSRNSGGLSFGLLQFF
jgi:outer membrane protein assembly factor BamA